MSNFKFTMLCNIMLHISYFICVTYAAVSFEKPLILWWYIFALMLPSWNCTSTPIEINKKTGDK